MEVVKTVAVDLLKVGEALGIPNLDPTAGKIMITGGTGPVGYRISQRLLKAGYSDVRLGVHQPDQVDAPDNVLEELVHFDWSNVDTYAKALEGVKSVMCTAPYSKNWQERFPAFLQACKDAGVKHIVKISFYHARRSGDDFQAVPLVKAHGDCDDMLVKSGLSYTILAATHFMSNPFVFQGQELRRDQKPAPFYGASKDRGVNYVSPNDVAEVAVKALLQPRVHFKKEYTLTGPEAITDQKVAELLSKHLDKPIMYADQPAHTFVETERSHGDPEWMVEDLVALEKIKASGKEEDASFVSKDIETLLGRKAQTFQEYLLATDTMTPIEAA